MAMPCSQSSSRQNAAMMGNANANDDADAVLSAWTLARVTARHECSYLDSRLLMMSFYNSLLLHWRHCFSSRSQRFMLALHVPKMYVCHICSCVREWRYVYVCVCVYARALFWVFCVCTCVSVSSCMYVQVCVWVCVYVRSWVCLNMYVYVFIRLRSVCECV